MRVLLASAKYGERLVFIGAGLLVTAGLTLAARFWSFRDGWIATSIGLVVAQGVAGSVVSRRMERLRGALESAPDGVPITDPTLLARDPVLLASNRISVAIIGEILFLMSVKPAAPRNPLVLARCSGNRDHRNLATLHAVATAASLPDGASAQGDANRSLGA
jgi:hypothetical protein